MLSSQQKARLGTFHLNNILPFRSTNLLGRFGVEGLAHDEGAADTERVGASAEALDFRGHRLVKLCGREGRFYFYRNATMHLLQSSTVRAAVLCLTSDRVCVCFSLGTRLAQQVLVLCRGETEPTKRQSSDEFAPSTRKKNRPFRFHLPVPTLHERMGATPDPRFQEVQHTFTQNYSMSSLHLLHPHR